MNEIFSCVALPFGIPCEIPDETVLCLGNFDGVHLGHRSLLQAAKDLQKSAFPKAACGVFCFHGLSSDFLSKNPPKHLDSEESRLAKFAACGMSFVIFADFARICDLSPEEFITSVLLSTCRAKAVVCGDNYRFGKGGTGTTDLLARTNGLSSVVLPELPIDGLPVSSTRIRHLLEVDGDAESASRLLGSPYALNAVVEHGKGLGHKLGVPTLNQSFPENALIPRHGVYLTETLVDGATYPGVSNVGLRPSVEKTEIANCETNLLSFSGSLYGKTVTTRFLAYLRPEKTFASENELQQAILDDLQKAKTYFENR